MMDIFFEKNTTKFKSITEICQNEKYDILDREMFCHVLTSKPFLKQLKIEELTEQEKNLMIEVINYSKIEEEKKKQYNEQVLKKEILNEKNVLEAIQKNERKLKLLKYLSDELQVRENELIIENAKSRK